MSQLKEFLAKLKEGKPFAEKIASLKSIDEVIAQAKEAGFEVTAEDVEAITDVSEEEIKEIAGGIKVFVATNGVVASGVVANS